MRGSKCGSGQFRQQTNHKLYSETYGFSASEIRERLQNDYGGTIKKPQGQWCGPPMACLVILPSEAHFWAARLCVDFVVHGFTKLHVRLACTSRMLSRTKLRANATSRGITRLTAGNVLLGLRIGMLCHPRTLSSCLTELCLAAWLSLSSFSAPIFIPGRENRMD